MPQKKKTDVTAVAGAGMTGPNAQLVTRFEATTCLILEGQEENLAAFLTHVGEIASEHPDLLISADDDEDFWRPADDFLSKYQPYNVKNGVLTIPVKGVLLNDFDFAVSDYATGYDYIMAAWDRGQADSAVKKIAFEVKSFGGQAAGNFELCDHMTKGDHKPQATFVNGAAYSGGMSIAACGKPLTATAGSGVGSIGVVSSHVDYSAALEKAGIKVTFIFAGKHKVDGNPYEALSKPVKDKIQKGVDETYAIFCNSVSKNRNMPVEDVRATEADTFTAKEALENGLIDKIEPFKTAVSAYRAAAEVKSEQPGDKKAMSTLTKEEHEAAVKADRARAASIMNCDEAKGKQKLAAELAYGEDAMSLDAAKRILAKAASEEPTLSAQERANLDAFNAAMGKGANVHSAVKPGEGGGDDDNEQRTPEQVAASIIGDYKASGGADVREKL